MKFYSTNNHNVSVSFEDALLRGLSSDYGLFTVPYGQVPILDMDVITSMVGTSYADVAFKILYPYLSEDFSSDELRILLADAYNPAHISASLQHVVGKTHLLWLTHGPTLSFKDFAARFFGRSLAHFLTKRNKKRLVVVATSGDTGGAIADALLGLDRVHCVVLYPKNYVSEVQRRQMTTLGRNVIAVAVNGDFDICQALVKRILNDQDFAENTYGDAEYITSANSISIGRLLPQIVFPFYAYAHIDHEENESFVSSVPSGNFGDMMGTVLARHMGLPIEKIVCGVNENTVFPDYLHTGNYIVKKTVASPSSAMMVSHPSNVARLFDLYGGHIGDVREGGKVVRTGVVDIQPDMNALRRDIFSSSVSNADHFSTIKKVYDKYGIVLDPHGAVGWKSLEDYAPVHDKLAFVYETADPAKFAPDIEKSIGITPAMPPQVLAQAMMKETILYIESDSQRGLDGSLQMSEDQYVELLEKISISH
ncbi:MAG: threonine synthase [Patescibacteria group bacterium]